MIRNFIHITLIFLATVALSFAQVPSLINYQGKIAVAGVNYNGTGQFKFALVNGGVNQSQTATATATVVNGFIVGATLTSGGSGYTAAPAVTVNGTGNGAQLLATITGEAVTGLQVVNPGSGYQLGSTTISVAPPTPNMALTTYWSNDGSSSSGSQPTVAVSLPVSNGCYSILLGDTQILNMQQIPPGVFKNNDVRLRVWFSDGSNGFQLMTPDQRLSAVGYAMIAANVPDGAINSNQLATGAVTDAKIAADSISTSKLSDGSVTAEKLADGAVTSLKIAANSISTEKLSSGAVTTDKLASGAVNSVKLADGAVGAEKLGDGAVSLASARDGNVLLTADKRADLENNGFVMIGSLNHTTLRIPNNAKLTGYMDRTAVWTGTEMIVWGGSDSVDTTGNLYNTGGRYNPTTNSWTSTSTAGAPTARRDHTAVWTGTEMIVWGGLVGGDYTNTGGRYNPITNSWTSTSTAGAPTARGDHTAVWTGTEMIVWGDSSNTGGRYNPTTNSWTTISTTGAPTGRLRHTAVWTGTEMIVWGGGDGGADTNTGGRYNPITNSWTSTSTAGAPSARRGHTAVWTGTEMIVWGRRATSFDTTGGRYNPITNSWTSTSTTGAPTGRIDCSVVWTGTEMIVWGGYMQGSPIIYKNDGLRYHPLTDVWDQLTPAYMEHTDTNFMRQSYRSEVWNVRPRSSHSAVWTGRSMILYSGTNSANASVETEIITPSQSYIYSKP